MHVAVVIVGFRNPGDVLACLAALERSSHEDFEVVIVENGGAEAFDALKAVTPARLAGAQAVSVLDAGGNLGFAGGVNLGVAQARGAEAWWILNPDTEPQPEALAAKVARLARGDVEAVGCTLVRLGGRVQSHGGRWRAWFARPESMGIGDPADLRPDPAAVEAQQNYLNGAAMLVGRRFVEVAGPMREDYFLYCEEVEWCLRATALGLRLGYAPGAVVLHRQGTTTGAAEETARRPPMPIYLGERNKMLTTRDRFPLRLPVAAVAALALTLARYGRARAWPQLGWALRGWAAGLRNQRGPGRWA